MKVITKYVANDNVEFLNELDCIRHEHNILAVEKIMSQLPEKPDSCDFSNGHGYIQHNEIDLLNVRNEFLEFLNKNKPGTNKKDFNYYFLMMGSINSVLKYKSIGNHVYRFQCIDGQFREWGQPYYAMDGNTPTDGDFVQLNEVK